MKKLSSKNKPLSVQSLKKMRAEKVWRTLEKAYPEAHCALLHRDPWQLLVATILSAQCTDKRVNMVTPVLFRRYPDARAFASADLDELMLLIRSTGFFRNKARNIRASAEKVITVYGGQVPDTMEELVTLSGVARKTANVLLFNAFGKNEGVVVDTHVGRTSRRLGLSAHEDPKKVEQDLMELFPRQNWGMLGHYLIELGRDVCKAPKPRCGDCKLNQFCPSSTVNRTKRSR